MEDLNDETIQYLHRIGKSTVEQLIEGLEIRRQQGAGVYSNITISGITIAEFAFLAGYLEESINNMQKELGVFSCKVGLLEDLRGVPITYSPLNNPSCEDPNTYHLHANAFFNKDHQQALRNP